MKSMKQLATETKTDHDGGEDDTRLFFREEHINVFANDMTRSRYEAMEIDLETYRAVGPGFTIYAWNDISGYAYWKTEGENDSSNYIQVTADINDVALVDPKTLKDAMEKCFFHFSRYDNTERHIFGQSA